MTTANEKLMAMIASKKQSMKKVENTVKLKPGENRVRLLPGWRSIDKSTGKVDVNGDPTFVQDFGQHYVKDASKQLKAVYICNYQTFGTPCEVCNALVSAARSAGDDETIKLINEAKSKRGYLMNVLMLDSAEPNRPQILEVGYGVMNEILNILAETESAPLNLINGNVLKITREGTGLTTKYHVSLALKNPTTMLTSDVSAESLKLIKDLDEYVKQESEEKQRLAIAAVGGLVGFTPVGSGGDVSTTRPALAAPAATSHSVPSMLDESTISLDSELDDLLAGM